MSLSSSSVAHVCLLCRYVGPPNARRIELRDIKRAVLKAIDPVKRRMAELPAETYLLLPPPPSLLLL